MNTFAASVFSSLNRRWLYRAYFIGVLLFGLNVGLLAMMLQDPNTPTKHEPPVVIAFVVLSVVNTVLFPFAKLAWDNTRDFILGGTVLVSNAAFLFIGKLFVNMVLWSLAIFIAPVGIVHLWFSQRATRRDQQTFQSGEQS
jgi:uncharacterized SAM-binding protein YcdF (DUF218 family)